MEQDENIVSMQMRFTYLVNKMQNLRNTISNQYCGNKVLKSLTKKFLRLRNTRKRVLL